MRLMIALVGMALLLVTAVVVPGLLQAGDLSSASGYSLLNPIRSGNLTVFPVLAGKSYDTAEFLTLDEGLRSGDVVVTEAGQARGLIRHRPGDNSVIRPGPTPGALVNQLVLVNNSKRPLLLLAGEIVTGGKQDRVIGKDRIVPAESDPVDLSVFCVEPGRWVAANGKYGFSPVANGAPGLLAAPVVRSKAMAAKDQQQVWDSVRSSQRAMAETVEVAGAAAAVNATTSYAHVMDNQEVQKQVDAVAEPVRHSYESVIRQLRDKNAVGVVVAVNGEIVWADIFASTQLLEKYWPKLVRSYATEAVVTRAKGGEASLKDAQGFLNHLEGRHETAETEPGLYRQTEITGDGFKVFELTSLLAKTGFPVHLAKMAD
jgi:hypothetical protein